MTWYVFGGIAVSLMVAAAAPAAPPKVVITSPDNGEVDVDPATKEIRVGFDQPMDPRGRSVVGGGETFPEIAGQPQWPNERTVVLPVKLRPDQQYHLSINSDSFKGFANKKGEPAECYPVQFRTRAEGAQPAEPDVTPEQNKEAMAALTEAIDKSYAYRDRKKVDWAKEIEKRRAKFENARSANEFARLTATCCAWPRTRTCGSTPATSASAPAPTRCPPTLMSRR